MTTQIERQFQKKYTFRKIFPHFREICPRFREYFREMFPNKTFCKGWVDRKNLENPAKIAIVEICFISALIEWYCSLVVVLHISQ